MPAESRAHSATLVLASALAACTASGTATDTDNVHARPDAAVARDAQSGEAHDASPGAQHDATLEPAMDGSAPDSGHDSGLPRADAGEGPTTPPFTLKVLSFNTWSGSAANVAADIASTGAHVVGMQEVTPGEAASICQALGAGWRVVQEDRDNTHAILSKLPVLQRIGVTTAARGGLGATLELGPTLRAHLFSTHLNWTPYGPYQLAIDKQTVEQVVSSENSARLPALTELLALAKPQVASADATFLVGDFNAPSHLDYEPAMPWPTSLAPHEAGLVDSYRELHPDNPKKWAGEFAIGDPGITWSPIPSSEPNDCYDRIDFVYYSANDATPLDSHELELEASDHRAVLTTFEVKEPTRMPTAQHPLPGHSHSNVARHPLLSWVRGQRATSERLYLGKAGANTLEAELEGSHVLPKLLAAGTTYHWRVDTVTPEGTVTGDSWTFTTRASGGLEPNKRRYAPTEPIQITFDGGNSAHDWIAIHPRNAAYAKGSPGEWRYLNNTQSAPGDTVAQGSITLTAPIAAGEYVLRFLDDDGYTVEDEVPLWVE